MFYLILIVVLIGYVQCYNVPFELKSPWLLCPLSSQYGGRSVINNGRNCQLNKAELTHGPNGKLSYHPNGIVVR